MGREAVGGSVGSETWRGRVMVSPSGEKSRSAGGGRWKQQGRGKTWRAEGGKGSFNKIGKSMLIFLME